jgi:serine protease
VAVLDTGLNLNTYDSIHCVIAGTDKVNGDNAPADGDGHGTHVTGTIAQNTNNDTGVAGLAHGACIMPVKVLDDSGSGSFADIAEGIAYVIKDDGNRKNVSYPAIYPTTIDVGATDYRNSVTHYSNKGTGLDMVTPGGDNGRDNDDYADRAEMVSITTVMALSMVDIWPS